MWTFSPSLTEAKLIMGRSKTLKTIRGFLQQLFPSNEESCVHARSRSDAAEPADVQSSTAKCVTVASDALSIHSEHTNKSYDLVVNLPASYDDGAGDRTFPVIYVLDAQWQYPLFHAVMGAIIFERDMPDAILVGISWQESTKGRIRTAGTEERQLDPAEKFKRLMALRNQDLTPTSVAKIPGSGQADKFNQFIREELVPEIDKRYRTNHHRTLVGASSSALFAVYSLLTQPDFFDAYIASSPAPVAWDGEVIFDILEDFSKKTLRKTTRIFLARGELELATEVDRLAHALQSSGVEHLHVGYEVVRRAGHASVNPESFNRGLQFIFQRPSISVANATLQALAGHYSDIDGNKVELFVKNNALTKNHSFHLSHRELPLCASSATSFYAQASAEEFEFMLSDLGTVDRLVWTSTDKTRTLYREAD